MEPFVAVILVNYNGYKDSVECVESLLEITYSNYKIFLVDNCSTEKEKLCNSSVLAQNTQIIESKVNLGFSGGNNLAIKLAMEEGFDYVLLINNDTTVEPDFLTKLVSAAQDNKETGIVAGKIYYYYQRDKVWSAGGEYDNKTGLTLQYSGDNLPEFDKKKYITFATGCLMLIPAAVVKKVGLLDETYFLYSEDSDYCQRVMAAGYKLIYEPQAVIYHKVSASTGDRSHMQQRYMMRNNLYMIKKYGTSKAKAYFSISIQMLKHIIRGRRNLMPTLKGYMDFLKGKKGKI